MGPKEQGLRRWLHHAAGYVWADPVTGELPRRVPFTCNPTDGTRRRMLHAKLELRVWAHVIRSYGPTLPLRPTLRMH